MAAEHGEKEKVLLLEEEMKSSYLTYAMSVIISRALPDVRDGLKPSQRRVLVAMNDLNLGPRAKYKKCAKIAGDTSGNYHPHGTPAIYEAMVRMGQDFSLRYPIINGQGNFGSVDGDAPAAERYTEARLMAMAEEMLADLEKELGFRSSFNFVPARYAVSIESGLAGTRTENKPLYCGLACGGISCTRNASQPRVDP